MKQLLVAYAGPRARMGERMSIGRDEVLHVARLAELAVHEDELDRLVDAAEPDRGLRRAARPGAGRRAWPTPFLAGPGRGRAARGRAGLRCRWPARRRRSRPSSRDGFFLVPRHGAMEEPVSGAAAVARGRRRRGWQRPTPTGLNATLHWSQALLDAEAARVDAMPDAGPLAAMPIALKDNIVTVEQPTHLRLADPRGLRVALQRDGGRAAARGRRDDRVQGEHGRVRHGLVHRALGLRPGEASARSRAGCPADRPAARPRWWRRAWCPPRSARRPAARCASRPASAAWWA